MPSIITEQPEITPGVSVIICCYNSAQRLPETLRHLAQQVSSGIAWEIIIIDNASTDDTASIAAAEWLKYTVPGAGFTVLSEPEPGKNYAFKKGVKAAKYSYLLTCDDDNWLASNYIEDAYRLMEASPQTGALGGMGIFNPQLPLRQEIADFKARYVNGSQTWAESEHWVYGAGSVYRKGVLDMLIRHNWQQVTTGRKGKSLICGEDVEICFMIWLCGYKIETNDSLQFQHYVAHSKQNIDYLLKLSYWLSYSSVLLVSYYTIFNNEDIKVVTDRWFLSAGKALIRNAGSLLLKRISSWKKLTVEQRMTFLSQYGTFISLLKNRKRICEHNRHTKTLLATINEPAAVK